MLGSTTFFGYSTPVHLPPRLRVVNAG